MQLADAKGRGDDDAVQRIQEKYKADINNLKASADAEKRRQQDALANRLKRRREAKERELRRRHERRRTDFRWKTGSKQEKYKNRSKRTINYKKNINEAKKDAENAVNITNSKEEALALLDEQAKMRQAIQKRHDEEENKLEEEIEVAALVDKLDRARYSIGPNEIGGRYAGYSGRH